MNKPRFTLVLLIGLCSFGAALAQPAPDPGTPITRVGMFWHYNVNQHRVDFASLPGVPGCCQQYESAIGTGFTVGALMDLRLGRDWSLGLRGSYGTHDATLTDTEHLNIPNNGVPVAAEIEHAIDASLASIDFDALFGYRLFAGLHAQLGFRIGAYIRSEYYQNESLVKPYRVGTFENGRRVRLEYTGDLPRLKQILGSVIMAASYELAMNENGTVFLVPELQYFLNVTPVVQDLDWYADGIHIGLALKFGTGNGYAPRSARPLRDEQAGWDRRDERRSDARTETPPNSLQYTDDARMPAGDVRERPLPSGNAPTTGERFGRHYEDDVDSEGQPYVTPPEQRSGQSDGEAADLTRKDLEPLPGDAAIAPRTRKIEKIQTAQPEPGIPLEELSVSAYGINPYGEETTFRAITAEEFGMTDVVTLLNYVFFHDNSSQIPSRYTLLERGEAKAFHIGNMDAGDKMRVHYNVLNIIGSRLQEYPDASVTIVGCNAAKGAESGRLDLSRSRAESVRDYLSAVWDIDSRRMTLVSRALPENPSEGSALADDENRRVEIYSDTWEILRPIVWTGSEWHSEPPSIRFEIPLIDEDEVAKWRFSVSQDNDVLKEYSGSQIMPESIDWNLVREQPFRAGIAAPVSYTLRVEAPDGQVFTSQAGRIPLTLTSAQEKRIAGLPDKEFTRYHLVIFERGEAESESYEAKVTEMVTSIFGSDAVITVIGMDGEEPTTETYADSALRAGANDAPVNTALPEGRFYSRAIRVLVEAPAVR